MALFMIRETQGECRGNTTDFRGDSGDCRGDTESVEETLQTLGETRETADCGVGYRAGTGDCR